MAMTWNPGVYPTADRYAAEAGLQSSAIAAQAMQRLGEGIMARHRALQRAMGEYQALTGEPGNGTSQMPEGTDRGPAVSGGTGDVGGEVMDAAGHPVQNPNSPEAMAARSKQGKALLSVADAYGLPQAEDMRNWSVDRIEGTIRGMAARAAMEQQAARAQETLARAGYYQGLEQYRRQEAEDSAAVGRALNVYGQVMANQGSPGFDPGDTSGLPPDIARTLESWRGYGASPGATRQEATAAALQAAGGGRAGERVLNTLLRYGDLQAADNPPSYDTQSVPGYTIVSRPGAAGLHILPTATTTEPEDVTDEGGNVIGNMVTSGGKRIFKPARKSGARYKAVPSLTDPSGWAMSVEADSPEEMQRGIEALRKATGAGTPGPDYQSADDVRAAYAAGKLARADAVKILKEKFGKK